MKEIHLSRSSESVFRIICDLCEADREHCLDDMILRASDTEIETRDGNLFILGEDRDDAGDGDYAFDKHGASWFRPLREGASENTDTGNRAWIKFIEDVSRRFHDKYAFLEYFHDKTKVQAANESVDEDIVASLCRMLGITCDGIEKADNDIHYGFFGVTLKLILSKNGFFQPVLAKMLFSGGRALKSELAARIIPALTTADSAARDATRATTRRGRDYKLEEVNTLLTTFFEELKAEGDLMDYLLLNSEEDEETLRNLEGYDATPIVCDNVKMLNLFYADWPSRGYDVLADSTPIFRFVFGPGNLLTLTCACGDVLIRDNVITCPVTYEGETEYEMELDPAAYRHNFGLDTQELAYLTSHNPARAHAFPIICHENIRVKGGCRRHRCLSDTLTFDATGRRYCADCPYAEVISRVDGVRCLTSSLVYSAGSHRPVKREDITYCAACARPFDDMQGERTCPVCRTLEMGKDEKDSPDYRRARKIYNTYAYMLPLTRRIFCHGARLGAEDEQVVVLCLGRRQYMYDKLTRKIRRMDV